MFYSAYKIVKRVILIFWVDVKIAKKRQLSVKQVPIMC